MEDRSLVRDDHVTVKVSCTEVETLKTLFELRRNERLAAGDKGVFTISAYVRELIAKDARRRGVPKKTGTG